MANPKDYFTSSINKITITSITHGGNIQFLAFVTDFSDQKTSSWNSQEIYGRMDPIYNYRNTTRKISIGFDVPSYDAAEAKENLGKSTYLSSWLYPIYNSSPLSGKGVRLISSPPLFRLKFSNFTEGENGVLGWIDGYTFKPEFDAGLFVDSNNILPKLFKVSFTLNVIHEQDLGKTVDTGQKNEDKEKVPKGQ